jgi:hypothetical protein
MYAEHSPASLVVGWRRRRPQRQPRHQLDGQKLGRPAAAARPAADWSWRRPHRLSAPPPAPPRAPCPAAALLPKATCGPSGQRGGAATAHSAAYRNRSERGDRSAQTHAPLSNVRRAAGRFSPRTGFARHNEYDAGGRGELGVRGRGVRRGVTEVHTGAASVSLRPQQRGEHRRPSSLNPPPVARRCGAAGGARMSHGDGWMLLRRPRGSLPHSALLPESPAASPAVCPCIRWRQPRSLHMNHHLPLASSTRAPCLTRRPIRGVGRVGSFQCFGARGVWRTDAAAGGVVMLAYAHGLPTLTVHPHGLACAPVEASHRSAHRGPRAVQHAARWSEHADLTVTAHTTGSARTRSRCVDMERARGTERHAMGLLTGDRGGRQQCESAGATLRHSA